MHKNDRETIISSLERVKLKKTLLNALNDEKIDNLHEILKVFIPIFEKNNEIVEDDLHFDCECLQPSPCYNEAEPENNVMAFTFCDKCGGELETKEPDWDLMIKGEKENV